MKRMKHAICCITAALLGWGMAQTAWAEEAPATPAPAPSEPVFARVNDHTISLQEFYARYNALIRQRFYHGAPPESQAEAVRQEVADVLIERELLVEEAGRRGIQPDETKVEKAVAAAETRYAAEPGWQQQREKLLPRLKEQISRQSLIEQVEKAIKDVPPPADTEARAFYDQKPDLFTEPEKLHMSIIVLSVDPSSPKEVWASAREEMQKILTRIKEGADFAEMARQYSSDKSAANGGNLGYIHEGMLSEPLQAKIDKFQTGEITEPVTILEGVAIYRLDNRVPSKLMEFSEVAQRAQDLLQRERVEQTWKETISRLRAAARIEILVPLGSGDGAKPGESAQPESGAKPEEGAKPDDSAKPGDGVKREDSAKPDAGTAKQKTGSKKKSGKQKNSK